MASFTILRDVGITLKKLLKDNLKDDIPELSKENSIIFDSPADIDPSEKARLSVFLYQIIENTYLKNAPRESIGVDQWQNPPLIVDLLYLFTPYAKDRETEIIIMEGLMQVLYDHSVLRGDMLENNLKQSGNDEIRIVYNNLSLEDINKLWERFPNNPFKLSVSYTLTPIRISSEKRKKIPRVIEKQIDIYRIDLKR